MDIGSDNYLFILYILNIVTKESERVTIFRVSRFFFQFTFFIFMFEIFWYFWGIEYIFLFENSPIYRFIFSILKNHQNFQKFDD